MSDLRARLITEALRKSEALGIDCDVDDADGVMRIVLSLERPVFDYRKVIDSWMFDVVIGAGVSNALPVYRGVDEPSLQSALRNGIDVEPGDAHWYGDALEKALEYGGDNPAVLIIDGNKIERPYKLIAANAPAERHEAARAWALGDPLLCGDGQTLKYSRLPLEDSRRGSAYETAYAWYIPDDPQSALLGYIQCIPKITTAKMKQYFRSDQPNM